MLQKQSSFPPNIFPKCGSPRPKTRAKDPKPEFGGGALERRSISRQVANRILSMIKSGNLKSGDRLPTEAQMGIAFGISRPPLREALKALTLAAATASSTPRLQGSSCRDAL
jgi:regulatory GntR family protein